MKEPAALADIQLTGDSRGVELQQVGVSGVDMPLCIRRVGRRDFHTWGRFQLTSSLAKELRGTHMSRCMSLLAELSRDGLSELSLTPLLRRAVTSLQASSAQISVDFQYFMEKGAPVTGLRAPMAYTCKLAGSLSRKNARELVSTRAAVVVPISSSCPCSKALAEEGAHSQRAVIKADFVLDPLENWDFLWIEDSIAALENVSSAPVYPLLKRVDEKSVTEQQFGNPKFVEDVLRDAVCLIRTWNKLRGFRVEVEAYESIHAHNAWACHQEGHFLEEA